MFIEYMHFPSIVNGTRVLSLIHISDASNKSGTTAETVP